MSGARHRYGVMTERWGWQPAAWMEAGLPTWAWRCGPRGLVTRRQTAGHFEVSVATIYRAIESGQLSAFKLGTGRGALRVTGAAVLAYAQACGPAAAVVSDGPA